jgi:ankyrin repeat protein
LLIKELADINAPPSPVDGRTAIDGAAEHGGLDMVQVLLNAGAVGDVLGKLGFANAIALAKRNKHRTVAMLLEEAEMHRRDERG